MKRKSKSLTSFGKLSLVTICAVYFLILVGGIVRSSGSGMGCPDWPRCFGNWVPPTSVSELPENYKDVYAEKRKQKNVRFASILNYLNFKEISETILNDQSIYQENDFNVTKTWIEYVNRLVGVIIGLLIVALAIVSLKYLKREISIAIFSISSLFLVIFQGWLGSIVVSTNLLPFLITLHMALALIIVCLIIYIFAKAEKGFITAFSDGKEKHDLILVSVLLILTFIQILSGTKVREEIDIISASNLIPRGNWIDNLGGVFLFHRSFSLLILVMHAFFVYRIFKNNNNRLIKNITLILSAVLFLEILMALLLGYFSFPAFAQPLHLFLGSIMLGLQFFILICLRYSNLLLKTETIALK